MLLFITDKIYQKQYLVFGHKEAYFAKEHSYSKCSEDDIIKMLEFLVNTIFVVFVGNVFQQTVYSNGIKLCSSSSRHIFLLIWSRIYTVFFLNGEETVGKYEFARGTSLASVNRSAEQRNRPRTASRLTRFVCLALRFNPKTHLFLKCV